MTFFDDLRKNFAAVAARATHVTINHDRLDAYADSLSRVPADKLLDSTHHYSGTAEETASYILALDSINFGSGYKPFLAAEGYNFVEGSIYFSASTRLKKHFETNGAMSAADMSSISANEIAGILHLDAEKPYSAELARLCNRALNQTGALVRDNFQGRFLTLLEAANGSVENFVRTLTTLSHFDDTHPYRGLRVAFHKRAQITAADLQLAFMQQGKTLFADTDRLTMFADNAVPHVLHLDGILSYSPALQDRIDKVSHLPAGSEEEVEIRACAAHVVELIAARKAMKAMDVDHILWHRSAEDSSYRKLPTHRTLTWFY